MKLWSHQQAALDFALNRPATLITAKMGGGKSKIAVSLLDSWDSHKTLILCPTTVRPVWRRELAKHSTRQVDAVILESGSIAMRTRLAESAWNGPRPAVIVMNYEASWRETFRSFALSHHWDAVILDESHRCQREGKTASFVAELGPWATRRLCLTGTALTQDPLSIWAQCRFLDPTIFGDDLESFTARYHNEHALPARKAVERQHKIVAACPTEWGFRPLNPPEAWMRGTINTDEYLSRLRRVACMVDVKLDLPPLMVEYRTCRLCDKAREAYQAIAQHHVDRPSHARGDLSRVMRLQQITSGYLPKPEGGNWHLDYGKRRLLCDLLRDMAGEPCVVFCRFRFDLDRVRGIAHHLGLRYGEISQRRKDGLSDMGQMPAGLQVVGVQAQSGGAGIDLTRASCAIVYSASWSLAEYDQALARVYRPPQSRPVVVYHLIASDTIDETIYAALAARRKIVGQVWATLRGVSSSTPEPLPAGMANC